MHKTQSEDMCCLRRARSAPIVALVGAFLFLVAAVPSIAQQKLHETAQQRVYRIGLTYPFPPWDVGPLEGVDYDLLSAICKANRPMHCMLQALPSEACVDTDAGGNMIIGQALASGAIDGCVAWYGTDARKQLGAEFTDGYSYGPQPQLIAANGDTRYDGVGASGSLESAQVGFISGFFNDTNCLARHYSDFTASFYSSTSSGRDEMIAALIGGDLDLVFWDSVATLPAGTHLVGEPVLDCGPQLSMMVFPPSTSRPHQSDALRRDFNCGLALIRRSGKMAQICSSWTQPGVDPACVLEGPEPTVQCLEQNPAATAVGKQNGP